MSTEAVQEFLAEVGRDAELRQELRRAIQGKPTTGEAIVEVAERHGHEFEVEELDEVVRAVRAQQTGELTDEDLESVAGGIKIEGIKGESRTALELAPKVFDPSGFFGGGSGIKF